ncbi:AAA family ATPase [Siculibacillus lacustris]|uniref:AAA family ATPase n=1 Tax=Siculibacillus lacustris TaxID=1549641 RepID=A0A4Q9VF49_9HYPH|nr:sigma 54-interacting transcriptional regulator [Siculibacillus lacustris]TBW32652.1 AAA family ATPase [Siculibacillus lacustris]
MTDVAIVPQHSGDMHERAIETILQRIDEVGAGTIAVDRFGHIVWISEKYLPLLGLKSGEEGIGHDIEDIIPNSLLRRVVETGEAIPLDIMQLGNRQLVVTRMPIKDDDGLVIGAVGFVLFDRVNALKPLLTKITKLQTDLAQMREKLNAQRRAKYSLDEYIGTSPAILEVKRLARRAAAQDTTVMLQGETGTGKELIAHAIHDNSARAEKPFVAVNVAAVPETLLEAEFFGTVPGAFTGADRRPREGKFQLTDGGTLFLDEIGDMPLTLQTKLLRALQEHEIEPLGSNRVIRVDVRVITATNVDLESAVTAGRFRRDLYYRLNVLPIRLPPLRECLTDLEALTLHLLDRLITTNGFPRRAIAPGAIDLLACYDFPGNVRELCNLIERAVILSDTPVLTAEDFAAVLPRPMVAAATAGRRTYAAALADFEATLIGDTLAAVRGRVDDAAAILDLSRATLYKKMARLGLASKQRD